MTDEDRIPVSRLDLGLLPPQERYPLWKESISVLFDADWKPARADEQFTAQVATCHLGQLLIGEAASLGQGLDRTASMIKRDGLDHCLLQVYTRGATRGRWGAQRSSAVATGDVLFLDLAQPFVSSTRDFRCLTLALPRALLTPKLGAPERFHGCRLPSDSALGRLLGEHLNTLWQTTGSANARQARAMANGLVDLIGAYFNESRVPADADQPGVALTLRESIRSYIDRNLSSPGLSPEHLAQHFRISRSHLFALFKPLGGVAGYIKRRRLTRAHALLSRPSPGQQVTDVSMLVGFVNAAHFSRAFREQFGASPSEVLEQGRLSIRRPHDDSSHPIDRRYEHWLRELV
jgi:AraC-like DNA-binding protein